MGTLHLNTTKKYFNTLMDIYSIATAYRTHSFPDSYCLVCTSLEGSSSLATEESELIITERRRKVVNLDGCTRFIVH